MYFKISFLSILRFTKNKKRKEKNMNLFFKTNYYSYLHILILIYAFKVLVTLMTL